MFSFKTPKVFPELPLKFSLNSESCLLTFLEDSTKQTIRFSLKLPRTFSHTSLKFFLNFHKSCSSINQWFYLILPESFPIITLEVFHQLSWKFFPEFPWYFSLSFAGCFPWTPWIVMQLPEFSKMFSFHDPKSFSELPNNVSWTFGSFFFQASLKVYS